MRFLKLTLVVFLAGCKPQSRSYWFEIEESGLRLGGAPISRVVLLDPQGAPRASQRSPAPVDELALRVALDPPGAWTARITGPEGEVLLPVPIPDLPPVSARLEAPVGQSATPITAGQTVQVAILEGTDAPVALTVVPRRDGPVQLHLGEEALDAPAARAGDRLVLMSRLQGAVSGEIRAGEAVIPFSVETRPLSAEALRAQLALVEVAFPAERLGFRDLARSPGRIELPGPLWSATLQSLGLGARLRDPWAPWAWLGARLENRGEEAVNLVVRGRILQGEEPDPAFRPRLRETDDGTGAVSVLLRVPPGQQATAALPVFVDEALLPAEGGAWTVEVAVTPLGASRPLIVDRQPVYVRRGSALATGGLATMLLSSLGGVGLLVFRGRRWLQQARTSDLMTVSLFGALSFLVSAVGTLIGLGLATLLGPFSTLLTGLLDDAFRYTLFATLIVLLPRPGTATGMLVVGWLLGGLVLGSFNPTDPLYLGSRILWLEGGLWLAGLTRGDGAWLQQARGWRWLRLWLGLGLPSALSSAAGLVLAMVFYRLYYAPWYMALLIAGPGFLYVGLGVALAVPFAEALRRVQR